MQRFFDILFSVVAIVICAPLFLFIIPLLRLTGEGHVFFLQSRIGRYGQPFHIYKFVTMLADSANMASGVVTVKNDVRILPVGRFLRKTKINELPQLFNILRGDMSLIGPRPLVHKSFTLYPEELKPLITSMRPGLSGIGSIIFRTEEDIIAEHHNVANFYGRYIIPYKAVLETWYAKRQNLLLYFMMIALTLWIVLCPRTALIWRVFRTLPAPPDELRRALAYPYE